jgi:beta-N-acetylhexosaminidase
MTKLYIPLFIMLTCFPIPSYSSWVEDTLHHMSIEEKIGQLFILSSKANRQEESEIQEGLIEPHHSFIDPDYLEDLITTYHIGGIIFLGKRTTQEQYTITKRLQQASKNVPLLVALDAEWGLGMRLSDGMNFPRAMTLGAIQDNQYIYEMAREIGTQCRKMGVHINLAPVVDVNNNPKNPIIGIRSFGDNPQDVAEKARAYFEGLRDTGIIACAKHFPGHGDTEKDSHCTMPTITGDRQRLDRIELVPFNTCIENNIPALMIGHLSVPALEPDKQVPASLSSNIIKSFIREKLQFQGLIIPDALGMKAVYGTSSHITVDPSSIALQALLAGNDLLLCASNIPASITKIRHAIDDGTISEKTLDEHVRRILIAKEWLFNQQMHPAVLPEQNITQKLSTIEAKNLLNELYEQAITVSHDPHNLIPLKPDTAYYLLTTAQEIPLQQHLCAQLPNIQCITKDVLPNTNPEIPIIVPIIGTTAFKQTVNQETVELLHTLQNHDNKTILIVCASPHLLIDMPHTEACLVAYEPGPEAQKAAAKVLIGTITAKGILPINIAKPTI